MFEYRLGPRHLYAAGGAALFTNNETNAERLYGSPNVSPLRQGRVPPLRRQRRETRVNPDGIGTKAAFHYHGDGAGEGSSVWHLR
jgi:hypothetical protein